MINLYLFFELDFATVSHAVKSHGETYVISETQVGAHRYNPNSKQIIVIKFSETKDKIFFHGVLHQAAGSN